MWKNADVPRSDVIPHPGHQTQSYRALLHHVSLTCGRMQTYPSQMYTPRLIEPSATELYYTMSVWYVKECRCTLVRCNPYPGNWTQCSFRTLLHHVSLTCGRMQAYPGQMYTPTRQPLCYRALLYHVNLTCGRMQTYPGQIYHPQVNPSGTEPYYTLSVGHVEAGRHTQDRCIHPVIEPSATQPYNTMSAWHVEECRYTKVSCTLLLIEPSGIEPYHTISVWYVEKCRCTQVRCTSPH